MKKLSRERCISCQERLLQVPWNTKGEILYCENLDCEKYRNPQGFVPLPPLVPEAEPPAELESELESEPEPKKKRKRRKNPKPKAFI